MASKKYSSMGKGLILRQDAHHIEWRFPVTIMVRPSMAQAIPTPRFTNLLAEDVSRCARVDMTMLSSKPSLTISPDWILQSTYLQTRAQLISQISVRITASEVSRISVALREKQFMLAVPNLIDFLGSIGTTTHTLALTYSVLNLSSENLWQEPPPGAIARRKRKQTLSRSWETLTDGNTGIGGLSPQPMNVSLCQLSPERMQTH